MLLKRSHRLLLGATVGMVTYIVLWGVSGVVSNVVATWHSECMDSLLQARAPLSEMGNCSPLGYELIRGVAISTGLAPALSLAYFIPTPAVLAINTSVYLLVGVLILRVGEWRTRITYFLGAVSLLILAGTCQYAVFMIGG